MTRSLYLLALFLTFAFLISSCSNDSSTDISGPWWPNYEPVNGGWGWLNPQPTGNSLLDVQFVDGNTGWACGLGGTILKTTDGGASWVLQQSGTGYPLRHITFHDPLNGWIAGGEESG